MLKPSSRRRRPLVASLLAAAVLAAGGGEDGGEPSGPSNDTVATLTASSAASQPAPVGTAVAAPPTVVARNGEGQPVAGATVTFTVTAGGGTLGSTSAQTDAGGVATAGSWTLGTTAGANTVTAAAGSITTQFTATGTPGPVAALTVVSGGGQEGEPGAALPNPAVVQAADAHGNAVPNATVAFAVTGGGTVATPSAATGANGQAQTAWTLGATEGVQTLSATVGTVTATATAMAATPVLLAAKIDAGAGAQCALSAAGQPSCWGANGGSGLVGDGTTTFRQFPVPISVAGLAVAQLSVGTSNSCALTTAGSAYCWGVGNANGDGSLDTPRLSPVAVSGGHTFTKVVVGDFAACALKTDGTIWCWGTKSPSESGAALTTPTLVSSTLLFTDVAVGSWPDGTIADHPCGISTTGATYCWGMTGIGEGAVPSQAPAVLGGGVTFSSLAFGRDHACGLTADRRAYCWGKNDLGQVGDNTSGNRRETPVAVAGGTAFVALAAGGNHSCGLTETGTVLCWGANNTGALGTGVVGNGSSIVGPTPSPVAVAAPAGVRFTSITAGVLNSCAIAESSTVYCWGTRATSNPSIVIIDPAPVVVRTR